MENFGKNLVGLDKFNISSKEILDLVKDMAKSPDGKIVLITIAGIAGVVIRNMGNTSAEKN